MVGQDAVVAAVGALVGALAGAGLRILLARLPRGMRFRRGPLEGLAAVLTAVGAIAAWRSPLVALLLLAGLLTVALGPIDALKHRLPDAITLPSILVAAGTVLGTWIVRPGSGSLIGAASTGAVLWAIFAGVAAVSERSMGRGDVKLIPSLGLLMGYPAATAAVLGLAIAFTLGSAVSVLGLATGRLRLRSAVPLGPFLLIGCWLVLLMWALRPGLLR